MARDTGSPPSPWAPPPLPAFSSTLVSLCFTSSYSNIEPPSSQNTLYLSLGTRGGGVAQEWRRERRVSWWCGGLEREDRVMVLLVGWVEGVCVCEV